MQYIDEIKGVVTSQLSLAFYGESVQLYPPK